MSKDYLESLERLAMPDELHIKECKKLGIGVTEDFDTVEKALLELKAIKEANPNEALECLESIKDALWDDDFHYQRHSKLLDTIEQALLKAQEPKQYLKWEDLEFEEETSRIEVKLNETLYTLSYVKRQYLDFVYLINNDSQIRLNSANDIQFFNDLHLERMEE